MTNANKEAFIRSFNYRVKISVRQDRTILLVCTLISLVFWFIVKLSKDYPSDTSFKLEYRLPEESVFTQFPPTQLEANLLGRGWDLLYYHVFRKAPTVVIDLRQTPTRGLTNRDLKDRLAVFFSTNSIKVTDVTANYLDLAIEPRLSKTVPVDLRLALAFAEEYDLQRQPQYTPDSVVVSGPASFVNSLLLWPTDTVRLEDVKESIQRSVPLRAPNNPSVQLKPQQIDIDVPVEKMVEKSLFVPVTVMNAPATDSLRIFPPSVMLTCVVGIGRYEVVLPENFAIIADLQGITPESNRNIVPLLLAKQPIETRKVRFTPQSAEFFFQMPDSTSVEPVIPLN